MPVEEEYEDVEELVDDEDDEREEEEEDVRPPKMHLMGDSGQTEEERRQLRRKQRQLHKDMEESGESLDVDEARDRNNAIFNKVKYTREAVLDGDNLTMIANKASNKVDKLIQVPRYDADRLAMALKNKMRVHGSFNWAAFGRETTVCFNAVSSRVSFLNGPLTDGKTLQVKQKAQRKKILETEHEEEKPEDYDGQATKDADQLSAVEQSMKVLSKTLHKEVNAHYKANKRRLEEAYSGESVPPEAKKKLKKHGANVCGAKYLFNPKSFTQTVENIFHYSFLVKKGAAALSVREKGYSPDGLGNVPGGIFVKYCKEENKHHKPRQAIVSLNMRDYRRLIEAFDVTDCTIPHRTGSKQTKRAQLSQPQS